MRLTLLLSLLAFLTNASYAQESPSNTATNCDLAQKELNLIKSQLDMVIAQYKITLKKNIQDQVKAGGGKKININVDPNNELVKSLTKLSVAEATFEAMFEMCKDGSLKSTNTTAPAAATTAPQDDYKAQLIPKP